MIDQAIAAGAPRDRDVGGGEAGSTDLDPRRNSGPSEERRSHRADAGRGIEGDPWAGIFPEQWS